MSYPTTLWLWNVHYEKLIIAESHRGDIFCLCEKITNMICAFNCYSLYFHPLILCSSFNTHGLLQWINCEIIAKLPPIVLQSLKLCSFTFCYRILIGFQCLTRGKSQRIEIRISFKKPSAKSWEYHLQLDIIKVKILKPIDIGIKNTGLVKTSHWNSQETYWWFSDLVFARIISVN